MNTLLRLASGLLLTMLILASGISHADDIDIYTTQPTGAVLQPATILVLDLNALGICDNVLTNPYSQPQCITSAANTTLAALLAPITGSSPTTVAGLPTSIICSLYGGLVSAGLTPILQIPAVTVLGVIITPAVPITTAVCNTLSSLGLGGLLGTITSTVAGVFNPLLGTTISNLSGTLLPVLDGALTAPVKVLADPLSLINLTTALNGIIAPLINSNLAVVVSHANRGNLNQPPTYYTPSGSTQSYACQFNDISTSSSVNAPLRATTTNCSNGGYFLLGFFNVSNTLSVVNKILGLALGGTVGGSGSVTGGLFNGGVVSGLSTLLSKPGAVITYPLTPPFQEVENYDEIVHYLKDDVVFNGPLAALDGIIAPASRDTSIETAPGSLSTDKYTGGASTVSTCRTVNVINLQLTNDTLESDSDADVIKSFPAVAPSSGTVSFPALVQTAQNTGFTGKDGKSVYLNSYFILQDNLLPNIAALQNVGANVLNYTTALGLFGAGQTITQAQTLVTNASLVSASNTSDRTTSNGLQPPTFFSLFKPQPGRKPAWQGNVKRLDLGSTVASDGNYHYYDAHTPTPLDGIDPTDGRISANALTIWTDPTLIGVNPASGTSIQVDGRETTYGGSGQKIPGYVPSKASNLAGGGGNPGIKNAANLRQLFYDSIPASGTPLLKALDADASASTFATEQTELAPYLNCTVATGNTSCQQLLLYARGYNVGTTAAPASNLATVTSRPWLMGGVLHSRPVAVNYGARTGYTKANPDIRVLFGSTDGFLRSIKNSVATTPAGTESWAFMPRAAMADLKTLRDNVYVPQFPYGVDSAPSVLIIDRGTGSSTAAADDVLDYTNPNDHVYAYFGLRRGGSAYATSGGYYYGLDITNPDVPKLMWRIGRDGVWSANATTPGLISGSNTQFTELAQTFGTPAIGQMKFTPNGGGTAVTRPVLLFGGGYNGGVSSTGVLIGKDLNNSKNTVTANRVGRDDTLGNALYIVDAVTGELIWKANRSATTALSPSTSTSTAPVFGHPLMQDSFASDVTALDTDGDGLIDRLYVGDTGGRVWRADFSGLDRTKWTAGPIASLGRGHPTGSAAADTTNANDRRFFHAPDFVPTRDTSGAYDVILIGAGDREDPFNTTTTNWLYALRDQDTVSGKTIGGSTNNDVIVSDPDSRLISQSSLTDITTACATPGVCAAANTLTNGWRLQLTDSGEKTTSAPVTIGKDVFISTYVPSLTPSCGPAEGASKVYSISLRDGSPFVQQYFQGPSSTSRTVATKAPGIAGEVTAQLFNSIAFNAQTVSLSIRQNYPVYWRERRSDEEAPIPQSH